MARATGLEPALHFCSALKGQWLYQFAYTRIDMVVGGGFEPPMFTTWVEVLQTSLFDQLQKPYDGY